tara:strand:+ start:540 stop:761 length:222 start_codon:yes stop_codon:yes gene_type:complete
MGLKPNIKPSPPVDQTLAQQEREASEKLEKEKQQSLAVSKRGRLGTLLTTGQGVTEEARTAKTILGGSGMGYG